jgi:hypothetical protein
VATPEEIRVFSLDPYQNLASILGSRLGENVARLDRQQQNHQRCKAKKVVDPGKFAECTTTEIH